MITKIHRGEKEFTSYLAPEPKLDWVEKAVVALTTIAFTGIAFGVGMAIWKLIN